MANIANYFNSRSVCGNVAGKGEESFVLSRSGKGSSQFHLTTAFKALLQDGSKVSEGDTVAINGEYYFAVSVRSSASGSTMAQLYKTNAKVDIFRISKHMTGIVHDYDEAILLHSGQVTLHEDINGRMQLYDIGLLSTTTKRFLLPALDVKLLDRITINGDSMQVDVINSSKYPNMLSVQCSPDTRVVQC